MSNPTNKVLTPEIVQRIRWLRKECGFGGITIAKLLNAECGQKHRYSWYTVQDVWNTDNHRGVK